jgi:hypothetical protein
MTLNRDETTELEESIVRLLETGPHTAAQLSDELHQSAKVISRRLVCLRSSGVIHAILNPEKAFPRAPMMWSTGDGGVSIVRPGEIPQRILTKGAAPYHQRDPLVAALFGPASNTSRCTHCRADEGTAHASNCGVARYV